MGDTGEKKVSMYVKNQMVMSKMGR